MFWAREVYFSCFLINQSDKYTRIVFTWGNKDVNGKYSITKCFGGDYMSEPWKNWIPGVLTKKQVKILCEKGYIKNVSKPNKAIDHSSIDLTLSDEGYEMVNGSIKPGGFEYRTTILENKHYAQPLEPQKYGVFELEKSHTYLFCLREKLNSSELIKSSIYGQATAKSSVGRTDVLARLIVDGMDIYEGFNPIGLGKGSGEMYLEITPITFKVRVKKSIPLSQLRLFYCEPETSKMGSKKELCNCLLKADNANLSVDLSGTEILKKDRSLYKNKIAAFKGKTEGNEVIDLWEHKEEDKPSPNDYWECIKENRKKRLLIKRDYFYILRSKERLCLPEGIAVYCRAIDEAIGEMRIHYAGFAHPFFGKNRKDGKEGTPLIFEVRGHSLDVNLKDGETLAKLEFFRMSEDCGPDNKKKNYNEQELKLSKFFREWE